MSLKDIILDVSGSKFPGYDQAAADAIIAAMDGGTPFRAACEEAGVTYVVAYRWRRLNVEKFGERIAEAQGSHYESKVEEGFLDIERAENKFELDRAKLKLDNAWKAVERLKPDRYSPTLITATRGTDGKLAPIAAMVVVPPKSDACEVEETRPPVENEAEK